MKTHSLRLDGKALCNRTIPLVERNTSTQPTCQACRNVVAKAILAARSFRRAQLAGCAVLALLLLSQLSGCLGDDASPITWRGQPVARVQPEEPAFRGHPACEQAVLDLVQCRTDKECPTGLVCLFIPPCTDPQTTDLWVGTCQTP